MFFTAECLSQNEHISLVKKYRVTCDVKKVLAHVPNDRFLAVTQTLIIQKCIIKNARFGDVYVSWGKVLQLIASLSSSRHDTHTVQENSMLCNKALTARVLEKESSIKYLQECYSLKESMQKEIVLVVHQTKHVLSVSWLYAYIYFINSWDERS